MDHTVDHTAISHQPSVIRIDLTSHPAILYDVQSPYAHVVLRSAVTASQLAKTQQQPHVGEKENALHTASPVPPARPALAQRCAQSSALVAETESILLPGGVPAAHRAIAAVMLGDTAA